VAKADDKRMQDGELALCGAATLDLQAAGTEGKKPRFTIVAYTGGPLEQAWWDAPVIVDMEGIECAQDTVILDNHGPPPMSAAPMRWTVVGQSDSAGVEGGKLVLRGAIFDQEQAAQDILRLARQGMKWQASIGAKCMVKDFVAEGSKVTVNGQEFAGPCYVSRKTKVREVSIVAIGADDQTSVLVASGRGGPIVAEKKDDEKTTFADYCKEKYDMSPDMMSDRMRARVMAEYDEENEEEDDDEDKKDKAKAAAKDDGEKEDDESDTGDRGEHEGRPKFKKAKASAGLDIRAARENYRREMAAEMKRQRGIRDLCAAHPDLSCEITEDGKKRKVVIMEEAIMAGWTKERTELAVLRASRQDPPLIPGGLGYSASAPQLTPEVVEAAVLQAGKCELFHEDFYKQHEVAPDIRERTLRELKARYTDQAQQHAHDLYRGGIGLQQVLVAGAALNGKRIKDRFSGDGDIEAALRACNWDIRAEGASTVSVANLLANVLNKFLLMGYLFVESSWRKVTAVRPVKDFKPTKSINLFGDFQYIQVGQDGQIKHATLQDQAFPNQAATYARILTINRQMIINDDLSGLTTTPQLMGRGAALKLNDVFWALFLNPGNADDAIAFWSASHTNPNYFTGAATNLQSSSLTTAVLTYDQQVDPAGKPLGLDPEILLVPPELDTTARELMNAEYLVGTGQTSQARQPNTNIWRGRFEVVKSRYLSNSAYTGYSATGWYLLGPPGVIPVIECAFLNGQEQPTVQTAQAEFQTLGISIRGFFDFGVAMQNFRGGVKSKGAA